MVHLKISHWFWRILDTTRTFSSETLRLMFSSWSAPSSCQNSINFCPPPALVHLLRHHYAICGAPKNLWVPVGKKATLPNGTIPTVAIDPIVDDLVREKEDRKHQTEDVRDFSKIKLRIVHSRHSFLYTASPYKPLAIRHFPVQNGK